ncbi:hypothetical protein V6N13_131941 [Hibiscus sabdariffa]
MFALIWFGLLAMAKMSTSGQSSTTHMVNSEDNWYWHLFEHLILQDVLLRITTVKGPNSTLANDLIGSRRTCDRMFTLKPVYLLRYGTLDSYIG